MNKGLLIVFSGPSGVGKGTLLTHYMHSAGNLVYSVSATTRAPRPGEVDGVNYHFMSVERFEEMINNGDMLEYALYSGNYYGTPKTFVDTMLESGKDVVLEIEVQGAQKIRESCPDALFIFVMPPSLEALSQRLVGRATEDQNTIKRRLDAAISEIRQAEQYDYIIVNDDLDLATIALGCVIEGAKCLAKYKKNLIEEVLKHA